MQLFRNRRLAINASPGAILALMLGSITSTAVADEPEWDGYAGEGFYAVVDGSTLVPVGPDLDAASPPTEPKPSPRSSTPSRLSPVMS